MKKVFIILLLIFTSTIFTGCNNREYTKDDFEIFITVDKENVTAGDELKITATFKNNSGHGLFIKMTHTTFHSLQSMVGAGAFKVDGYHRHPIIAVKGPLKVLWLKKDQVIVREFVFKEQFEFQEEETCIYDCLAYVSFYTGKSFENYISIESDYIQIVATK